MLNRPAISAAFFVLLTVVAVLPSPAADPFNPQEGWSVSTTRPLDETAREVASRTYTGGISQPRPNSAPRRPRRKSAAAQRSTHTDREQRIALGKLAEESTSGNPLRKAGHADAVPPEPAEWDADQRIGDANGGVKEASESGTVELIQPAALEVDVPAARSILPAGYEAFAPSAIDPAPSNDQHTAATAASYVEPEFEPIATCACEPACGVEYSCDPGCASHVGTFTTPTAPGWAIGYELVLVKPRFENNVAFTVMESDGANSDTFTEMEFDYDRDPTTRVWMDYELAGGLGARAIYWHFDELPTTASTTPPANGFGFILHPDFGDIDISTNVPTDMFTARSTIEVFCVDLEMTKSLTSGSWTTVFSGGLRYAEIEQSYLAQRRAQDGTLLGEIDFAHHLKGIGPTIGMQAARPLIGTLRAFSTVRGSLLFGDGEARLESIEGAPTDPPLVTARNSGRDDLLPIGEMQAGLFWECPTGQNAMMRPFLMAAMEGQVWGGAGNAASEDGSVGFFGVSLGGGMTW